MYILRQKFALVVCFNICRDKSTFLCCFFSTFATEVGSRYCFLIFFHNENRFLFYIFIISIITGFDVSSNSCLFLMCNGSWFLFLSISRFEYPFPLFFSCVLSSLVSLGLLFCTCVCYPLNENMFTHGYEKKNI